MACFIATVKHASRDQCLMAEYESTLYTQTTSRIFVDLWWSLLTVKWGHRSHWWWYGGDEGVLSSLLHRFVEGIETNKTSASLFPLLCFLKLEFKTKACKIKRQSGMLSELYVCQLFIVWVLGSFFTAEDITLGFCLDYDQGQVSVTYLLLYARWK